MITALDLFGRATLTQKEKKELRAAQDAANSLFFKSRNQEEFSSMRDMSLNQIEQQIISTLKEEKIACRLKTVK